MNGVINETSLHFAQALHYHYYARLTNLDYLLSNTFTVKASMITLGQKDPIFFLFLESFIRRGGLTNRKTKKITVYNFSVFFAPHDIA